MKNDTGKKWRRQGLRDGKYFLTDTVKSSHLDSPGDREKQDKQQASLRERYCRLLLLTRIIFGQTTSL